MGCGVSRLDKEEEMPKGLRPFRTRIEEMKRRRRRERNLSIVSTAELLRPHEVRVVVDEDTCQEEAASVIAKEQEVEEEEELPGSPSFRIYFKNTSTQESDDDSVKIVQRIKNEKLKAKAKETSTSNAHRRKSSSESLGSNTSGEGSRTKSTKERGRRFKALTKALTVRHCYILSCAAAATQANARLVPEKAT